MGVISALHKKNFDKKDFEKCYMIKLALCKLAFEIH
jgi:hypothetical protein